MKIKLVEIYGDGSNLHDPHVLLERALKPLEIASIRVGNLLAASSLNELLSAKEALQAASLGGSTYLILLIEE